MKENKSTTLVKSLIYRIINQSKMLSIAVIHRTSLAEKSATVLDKSEMICYILSEGWRIKSFNFPE